LAWQNKTTLRLATAAIDAAYLARRALGGKRPAAPVAVDPGADPGLLAYNRYRARFQEVEGWTVEGAMVTWDVLLSHQDASGVTGDLLEIGVLNGKSALLMALHAAGNETMLLVDPALRREAIDLVSDAHPSPNVTLSLRSDEIAELPEIRSRRGQLRWIHVDGEHSGRAVRNDLAIAAGLLAPRGVICLDDFFTEVYPQITAAAFSWLEQHPELRLFLVGYHKGYVCRAEAVDEYLRFVRDSLVPGYRRRGFGDFTLYKTTDPADMNCFGVYPRGVRDLDFRGPDWAPDQITI
jgi:predicted O-methyltransferase YrrM